jgi:eukaryotic-like serine/threonine-protein kinase
LIVPQLGAGGTFSGLRATQVASVTDLMQELTRQRRVTTRLLSGLLALVGVAMLIGLYLLLQRPAPAPMVTAPTAAAAAMPNAVAGALTTVSTPTPTVASVAKPPRATAPLPIAQRLPVTPRATSPLRHATSTAVASFDAAPTTSVATPTPAETGTLNLDTTPWSIVSVAGRVLGQTPIVGASLPAGTHTLWLSNPEQGLKTAYQVTISAGRVTSRRVGLD